MHSKILYLRFNLHLYQGVLTLTLGYTRPTSFTYKLTYGSAREDKLNGISAARYVLQEMTQDRLTYYFRAPRPGDYHLTIFAREVDINAPKLKSMVFKAAVEFKIISAEAAPRNVSAFPYCSDSSFGLDSYVHQYPMLPTNQRAILMCPGGSGEVAFDKDPSIRVYARLVKDGKPFDELKKCIVVKDKEADGARATVAVQLPEEGEYALEVFANDPKQDGDMFAHFCQYLCTYAQPADFEKMYGKVAERNDLQVML